MTAFTDKASKAFMILLAIFLFFSFLGINTRIRFYGDDLFYYQFSQNGFSYFLNHHIEHYFRANGRAIVHVLVSLFLYLPPMVWQICNSLVLVHISFLAVDLVCIKDNNNGKRIFVMLFIMIAMASLHPNMTSQSVFWTTGSLNYLYPLWILLFFMRSYLYSSKKWMLFILCFLASFSVEQVSMMTFGFLVLNHMSEFYQANKESKKMKIQRESYFLFAISLLGLASLVLGPSVFLRASLEEHASLSFFQLINDNVIKQGEIFFFAKEMLPIHIVFLMVFLTYLIRMFQSKIILYSLDKFIFIGGILATSIGFIQHILVASTLIQLSESANVAVAVLLGISYFALMIRCGVIHCVEKNDPRTFILFLLGIGSIFMMLVSPAFGFRNFLFAYLIFFVFAITLLAEKNGYRYLYTYVFAIVIIKQQFKIGLIILVVFILGLVIAKIYKDYFENEMRKGVFSAIIVVLLCSKLFLGLFYGYNANAAVYDRNVKASTQIESIDPLGHVSQRKLENYDYRWVMPYENSYYSPYYNLYLGLKQDTVIEWK